MRRPARAAGPRRPRRGSPSRRRSRAAGGGSRPRAPTRRSWRSGSARARSASRARRRRRVGGDDDGRGLADAGLLEHARRGRRRRGRRRSRRASPPRRRRDRGRRRRSGRGRRRARGASSIAARPLVPKPQTMVWPFKVLLQIRCRHALRELLGEHLDRRAHQDDEEQHARGRDEQRGSSAARCRSPA